MTLEEKKQVYLDKFPAIIGRRMAEQFDEKFFKLDDQLFNIKESGHLRLIMRFSNWTLTVEKHGFWQEVFDLYYLNETIEHQQILDIFHKHGIKP